MSNRQQQDRRGFLRLGTIAIVASAVPGLAMAQARVEESDPQAASLGYRNDTTKVDKAKFPKHDASQKCSGCQLFQGKASDADRTVRDLPGQGGLRQRVVQRLEQEGLKRPSRPAARQSSVAPSVRLRHCRHSRYAPHALAVSISATPLPYSR